MSRKKLPNHMSVPECRECRDLIKQFSITSNRHLNARRVLDSTIKLSPLAKERISVLEWLVASCAQSREDAIEQFRAHAVAHDRPGYGASYAALGLRLVSVHEKSLP
jgi:hypothetical protein